MTDLYYYVLVWNTYQVESTESLYELVTLLYNGQAEFISEGQIIQLALDKDYNLSLKKIISKFKEMVPLYDISFNHIYLVHRENIYPRMYYDNYRFTDDNFYRDLLSQVDPSEIDLNNIRILSHYDLKTLYKTYMGLFYKSFIENKYITSCRRPSFASQMDHITPYYTINELYFLAYDWNLTSEVNLSETELEHLCKEISNFDIPAETLLDHQLYIYNSNAIGLVKHYSLFGSYYMNVYLRKNRCCLREIDTFHNFIRNMYLEKQIEIMIALIKDAPQFKKSHTVYRFIEKDDYMQHLSIGDIYQDASFMSTTRNPFYYKELSNYAFGLILLKIRLPKNIRGIGISIEAYSNFPKEEEIVLPPTSRYKLIRVTEAKQDIHFHDIFKLKIQKKYEFEWVGNDYIGVEGDSAHIRLNMPNAIIPIIENIDLLKIVREDPNLKQLTISDRLKYFKDTYVKNFNNQFACILNNTRYIFNFESYNSSSVYKPFFYYEVSDGIMVTTANPKYGNINLIMEIGQKEIHVNYYFRFSVTDLSMVVDLNRAEWIQWLSLFAYIIGSRTVVIHSYYDLMKGTKTDSIEKIRVKTRYTFSRNIYVYLKYKKKMFEFSDVVLAEFDYGQLDYLFGYPVSDVIKITDIDELYYITEKSKITNMGDLYIYIVENHPKLIRDIEEKMDLIFDEPSRNPFKNISYKLDAWAYLYDIELIKQIPSEKEFKVKKGSFKKLIGDKKIPKFKNRLRTYLLKQTL